MKIFAFWTAASLLVSSAALAQDAEVMPDKTTSVMVSNRDVNRIRCSGNVEQVEYSTEKPATVKSAGSDVFVKFKLRRENGLENYVTTPFDLHIVCAGEVYTLILRPRDQDSTTVRLGSGARRVLQEVVKEWGALPLEDKIKRLTLMVVKNEIPSNFARSLVDRTDPRYNVRLFKDVEVVGRSEIVARGTGLKVVEYALVAHKGVTFSEKDFISPKIGADIVGITVHPLSVEKDGLARLIVVERSIDNGL